jgi:DNA repair exonuclease SbcCD ATPase subunit
MAGNRKLTDHERTSVFAPMVADVRAKLRELAGADDGLHWALRRKLAKELTYDERSKPMQRKALKAKKRKEQGGLCPVCSRDLPEKYTVIDRLTAMGGYTPENTQLICAECDLKIQTERRLQLAFVMSTGLNPALSLGGIWPALHPRIAALELGLF